MAADSILPPGVSAGDFVRALRQFKGIVGEDFVFTSAERMLPYRKLLIPADADEFAASGVIAPDAMEQIPPILAVCNRFRIPVWPISTGRNFGYGSASPATRGQMILDLKRMNRIIGVDPELCTALVEPGVTYQQLQDYLAERNYPLWLDFPGPGPIVGPVGNTLERGGGNTPYGDHFANACGMEVVLADGQVLRTGMGSNQQSTSWQVFKYGYGPYLDGIFTQSNFGVVTKLGLWLMPKPAGARSIIVSYEADEMVGAAVEVIRPLRIDGTIRSVGVMVNTPIMLTAVTRRAAIYSGAGAVPQEVIRGAAQKYGMGAWTVLFTLYGTEQQLAPDVEIITRAFERSAGKVTATPFNGSPTNDLSLSSFSLLNWVGGGGLYWFAPVSPARGADMVRQQALARAILADHGFDYLAAPTLNGRDLHHLIALVFDRNDQAQSHRAKLCYRTLTTEFARNGYGLYRVAIDFMDELADLYGKTNRDVNRRIKRALDPNGILAPGKSGIHL